MFKNLLDIILVGFGIIQSFFKLLFWRPDVIFTKGGFVCLPVGVAAHILRIPLVIHDSDAHPGLTNRILSKWATKIATGAPLEYYNYPKSKTSYIGIPIHEDFKPSNLTQSAAAKAEWGVKPDFPLLVVTGGGLGATRINNSVLSALSSLQQYCSVVLVSGTGHFDELRALVPEDSETFKLHAFVSKMPSLLTAADVVATRAGATTILELAAAHKPTIVIPNAKLTGGHQVKNAKVYADAGAVLVVDEDGMLNDPQILVEAVRKLVVDTKLAGKMSEAFGKFAKPNAAKDMADIILSTVAK